MLLAHFDFCSCGYSFSFKGEAKEKAKVEKVEAPIPQGNYLLKHL